MASIINFVITELLLISSANLYFNKKDNSFFEFLKYFKKYTSLIFIGSVYAISLFIHNIIIWTTSLGFQVAGVFYLAPAYDYPAFFALLTIIPSMVMFVVKTETSFFEDYKKYIGILSGGGTGMDLENCYVDMKTNLYRELIKLLQTQFLITLICIVASRYVFSYLGIGYEGVVFFGYLAIGYFYVITIHIVSTIILYFDNRKCALLINVVFLILQVVFVSISVQIGENVYGLGTAIAGIISAGFAFIMLEIVLKNLDYDLYSSQPIYSVK